LTGMGSLVRIQYNPQEKKEGVSKEAALFFILLLALRPGGPRCRIATEPGASRHCRDPLTGSGTAPAKVAYAATGVF